MNINDLTIGQARELVLLFGENKSHGESPWILGQSYLIRTVTMTLTGRLRSITEHELVLEDAAWIADTGRFSNALKDGNLNEIEPFPDNYPVIVGRGSVIDASHWNHPLPRIQK